MLTRDEAIDLRTRHLHGANLSPELVAQAIAVIQQPVESRPKRTRKVRRPEDRVQESLLREAIKARRRK